MPRLARFALFAHLSFGVALAHASSADTSYADGLAAFNSGHYPQAIELFEKGYAASALPGFLFNIALAYRRLGDCPRALEYYRRFLTASPDAPNRKKIEA